MIKEELLEKVRKNNVNLVNKLIKIGKSLSLENDIKKIFNIILNEVMEFTKADRGIIYITSPDGKELYYELVKTVTQNQEMDAETARANWDTIKLFSESGELIMKSLATFVFHTGFEAHFDDIYGQDFFQIDLTREMDNKTGYHSHSMVAIPLVDHEEKVLGIIELTNSIDDKGSIVAFTEEHIDVLLSVASQAAITLSNKLLINNLEKMIFDFTQAIALAIDMKSVDSYKHVQNVASLTNILAKEINSVDYGSYAKTRFSSDELEEIAISGWLHDLGKIATSERLLNKNTKLLANYDRIHVLDLRFELLQQVIENLLQLNNPLEDINTLKNIITILPAYKEFLLNVNNGSEFLTDEQIVTLQKIAAVKVTHKDKTYYLLDDNELENLLIRRGTLTPAEYSTIQEHASLTFQILSNINFPQKYKNVPRIASMHHERLNGKGYPQGLSEDQIPLQSRILAIADVFDALMSKRSYKNGYGLQKSLTILANMAKNNELDKDLLDILINNGVYQKFAEFYDGKDVEQTDIETIRKIYRN
ncbi:MAG: GAF domain-containing protein [Candidatus Cloacimonetes bacterium]|nr:GAF domain-containing protein [Candidatus Cloacimonadota bacterium]